MDDKLNQLLSIQNENNCGVIHDVECLSLKGDNESVGTCTLKVWLNEIGFINYYDLLIEQGFDSLVMMKEINVPKDLEYIGINLKAHQLKLIN
eukprot:UN12995